MQVTDSKFIQGLGNNFFLRYILSFTTRPPPINMIRRQATGQGGRVMEQQVLSDTCTVNKQEAGPYYCVMSETAMRWGMLSVTT